MKTWLILFLPFLIASCSTPEKMLQRAWKVNDVALIDSSNNLTQMQKEVLSNALRHDVIFSFGADSVYKVSSGGRPSADGKWYLSADKKTLFTTTREMKVESKILGLTKYYLEFQSKDNNDRYMKFSCSPTGEKK